MRLRKEKAIVTIYDAVSILKGFNVVNGSLTQNYYAESATYVPNRYIIPLVLRPKIDVSDPNNVIENGDKVDELSRLEWFENGVKINSNDDFKIEGANLTIFKNSEEPFELSYRAEWFDTRKKQVITIEDSVVVSCISLAQSDANVTMSLSKPQNWVHNPLKGERIYTINAYVSKDKVHESAVEWYYVDSNKNDVLIDETCNFYVGGQYTNALKVDSAYMDNVIIKAKNISNDKLKEVYWFFDKHGNPLTYAMPDKTIIEGSNVFSLPESPITSKLDYRIEGLSLINKATEVIKGGGDFSKDNIYWRYYEDAVKSFSINKNGITVESKDGENSVQVGYYGNIYFDNYYTILRVHSNSNIDETIFAYSATSVNVSPIHRGGYTYYIDKFSTPFGSLNRPVYKFLNSEGKSLKVTLNYMMLIPAYLLEGYSKERIVDNIQGYFEGTKSVTAPLRIKSEIGGRNYLLNTDINIEKIIPWDKEDYTLDDNILTIKPNYGVRFAVGFPISKSIPIGEIVTLTFDYSLNIKPDFDYIYINTNQGAATGQISLGSFKKYDGSWDRLSIRFKVPDRSYKVLYIGCHSPNKEAVMKIRNKSVSVQTHKHADWTPAPEDNQPATGGTLYINNNLELKSVGTVKDYIENGKLYKYISDDGQILEQPEIVNLSTQGSLTTHPNGTIFIEPATLVEQQYSDGLQVDLPVKSLTSIKVGAEYLDVSKAVVKENLITHPDLENGDFVTIEYIYDDNPIYGTNSIGYLSLEEILDDLWLDNVYTYKVTNGEWELVKITDIEDYEEWLKTEKTSPYTLAPDGVIFGSYEAETKFIRQYPSSLYVDIIAPTRLKQGITKIKARVLVGTRDGVVENPSNYFHFVWYRKENQAGAVETIIGHGEEIEIDIKEKDMIGVELQSLGVLSDTKTGDDRTLTDDENRKITLR